jgi:hypothetical protein
MRCSAQKFGMLLAAALVATSMFLSPASAADKAQTFTGEVGDAMCGAKHMGGSAAECTRKCASKGSTYALVVGDKVYTLQTSDKAALDSLDKLAGQKAKVTGTASGDTIQVASVAASK